MSDTWASQDIMQLVNVSLLRPVFLSFYEATGISVRLVGMDLTEFLAIGPRRLCFDFHRRHPVTACHCRANEKTLQAALEDGQPFVLSECGNGLLDAACAVKVRGQHVATVVTGELLTDSADLEWFRCYARRHGFPEKLYLSLVREVPVLKEQVIRSSLACCAHAASLLVEQAMQRDDAGQLSRERAALLLQTDHEACLCLDQSMTICDANPSAAISLGLDVGDLIGRRCHELWHGQPDPCRHCVAAEALQSGKVACGQTRSNDGRWLNIRGYPVHGTDTTARQVVVTMVDVTGRMQAEDQVRCQREELDRAMRAAAMGELAASVAHELSQPLGAILANAQAVQRLLSNDNPNTEECLDALMDIAADAWRAGEGIRRLRRLSGSVRMDVERIDLRDLIADTVHLMQHDLQSVACEVTLDVDRETMTVEGDRAQLQQVFTHLMRNACEAQRGRLDGRLTLSVQRSGRSCVVSVVDNGPGLRVAEADALYDMFFTTKHEGIGTGLAIARSVIEAHGGRIRGENVQGGGARFQVRLPLAL